MIQVTLDTGGLEQLGKQLMFLTDKNIRYATGRAMAGTVRATEQALKKDLADPSGPIDKGATRWTIGGTYTVGRHPPTSPQRLACAATHHVLQVATSRC